MTAHAQSSAAAEAIRQKLRAAVALIQFRQKTVNETDIPCSSLTQGRSVWASGAIVSKEGFVLTAKHTFGLFDKKKDAACAWAYVRGSDGLKKHVLDLHSLRYGDSGDYADIRFADFLPRTSIRFDADKLRSYEIQQGEPLYFIGFEGPAGEVASLDSLDAIAPKATPVNLEAGCAGGKICDMVRATAYGNSGGPVVSKSGEIVGLVIQQIGLQKGRFLHIGHLADFLAKHRVKPPGVDDTISDAECKLAKPRLELKFYKYSGVAQNNENQFSLFHGIMRDKVSQLRYELRSSGFKLNYLDGLSVNPVSSDSSAFEPPPRDHDIERDWAETPEQLISLRGLLFPDSSRYKVRSSIYWGKWDADYTIRLNSTVRATLELIPERAEQALDSHSLMTLFALAMDSKARQCDSATVAHLFQAALNKANDLERAGDLSGDLVSVRDFIVSALAKKD